MKKMRRSLWIGILSLIAMLCLAVAACGESGIKFNFVTGEGAPEVSAIELEAGEESTLPTPEWEGYSFEGWYLDPSFTGEPVVTQKAEESKTFYAKWEKMYLVTLDVGDGDPSAHTFYLKKGADLAAALADRVPEKEGFEFGEWLSGTTPLSKNAKMPEQDLTLTAHYKVGYSVKIFQQDLKDGSKYNQVEDYQGFAYADGTPFTVDYAPEGFEIVEHAGDHRSGTLDANDPSKNAFVLYYDRKEITVFLRSDASQDAESDTVTGKYGEEIELPADTFKRDGHLLTGWSETSDGKEAYHVSHDVLNGTKPAADKYTLTERTILYAVWQSPCVDIFGGNDHIFLVDKTIYLERAGYLFVGRSAASNVYTFASNNRTILTCRVFASDGFFCYENDARKGTATLYQGGDLIDGVTMEFDEYNGITYTVTDADGVVSSSQSGTYFIDEDGYYHTQFTSGENFIFLRSTVQSGTVEVFMVRNDEEVSSGAKRVYYYLLGEKKDFGMTIELNGLGIATVIDERQGTQQSFLYEMDEQSFDFPVLILADQIYQQIWGVFAIQTEGNSTFYAYFDYSLAGGFHEYEGDGVLTLDGFGGATFTVGTEETEGYYDVEYGNSETILYLYIERDDGGYDTKVFSLFMEPSIFGMYMYYYEQYADTYGEYYYSQNEGYGYPYMIAGQDPSNPDGFTLYGQTEDDNLVEIASGTLAYDEETKVYTATVTEKIESDTNLVPLPFSPSKLAGFEFTSITLNTTNGIVTLMFWSSVTLDGAEQKQLLSAQYKGTAGAEGQTLDITNGYAVYTDKEGKKHEGVYQEDETGSYVAFFEGDELGELDVELDETAKTFKIVTYLYEVEKSGTVTGNSFIQTYGTDGADYCVLTRDPDTNEYVLTKTEGTYVLYQKDFAAFEGLKFDIYTFTSKDSKLTFHYCFYTNASTGVSYCIREDEMAGTYAAAKDGELILDGYLDAYYTPANGGPAQVGSYAVYDEDIYLFLSLDQTTAFLFSISSTQEGALTYEKIGGEYGEYLVIKNGDLADEYYVFDGKNGLTILLDEKDGDTTTTKTVAKGTYSLRDDGLYALEFTYTDDPSKHDTLVGARMVQSLGSITIAFFNVYYEETVNVYLNRSDWTVLYLDGFGGAERLLKNGLIEQGTYYIIDEDLIYYLDMSETQEYLFALDSENGEMVEVDYDETGYYTKDFDALLFSSLGTLTYGDDTVFYSIADDDNVTLYYPASSLKDRKEGDVENKYGFVERAFGILNSEIDFEGKHYFRNDGYSITFERAQSNAGAYPIPEGMGADDGTTAGNLIFIPGNGGDFTATGRIILTVDGADSQTVCTISRKEGQFTVSVLNDYGETLEFSIAIDYKGESGSTYAVTAMRSGMVYYASDYMMSYNGAYGILQSWTNYDAAGAPIGDGQELMNGEFDADFGLTDRNGDPILSFENGVCEVPEDIYTGLYTVAFEHNGEQYFLYYDIDPTYAFFYGIYMFDAVALTCRQTLTDTTGKYEITADRVISSEYYDVGGLYTVAVKDAVTNENVECVDIYAAQNKAILVLSEDDNNNTEELLTVTFTENTTTVGNAIVDYEAAVAEVRTATTYVDADWGDYLVAVYKDGAVFEVAYMLYADYYNYALTYMPVSSTAVQEDGTYLVTSYDYQYTVSFDEDGVHVTPPENAGGDWDDWFDEWLDEWLNGGYAWY